MKIPYLPLGVSPRQGAFALIIGGLGAAAFPPIGLFPLIFVSIALFLLLIRNHDPQTARNLGLLYGLTFALGTMYWLFAIFKTMAIPLVAIMAAYFGILATLIAMTRSHGPLVRAGLVAMIAIGIEWLRGDAWYLRFPWFTPPHALALAPTWIAPVHWLGTYGFSYAIWFIAALGAFWRMPIWAAFLVVPFAWLLLPRLDAPNRRALLIQSEVEPVELWIARVPKDKVDLVVMPEYAYTRSPASALASTHSPASLAKTLSAPVVFGAVEGEYGSADFFNVAAVIDTNGELLGTIPKQRPVPLMADGIPGQRRQVFPVGQGSLGVAVCYDFDAPEVAAWLARHDATVFVDPTFDAIEWGRVQHVNHEQILRLRAVENDRWIVRCASSGRSEVIDPHGIPSQQGIEIGERGYATLPFGHRRSFALGGQLYFLGPACAGATILFLVYRAVCFLRRRTGLPANPQVATPAETPAL
jgi:apolipoprotein N-acyltransferase